MSSNRPAGRATRASAMCAATAAIALHATADPRLITGPDFDATNGASITYPGPLIKTYRPDPNALGGFAELDSFFAYDPSFTGGVRVAAGDINGDGTPDIVTAPGPGAGPQIKVFDGITHRLLTEFLAFDPDFTGGVRVATGDVNGDGRDDIITGVDPGGGPQVRVFDGLNNAELGGFSPFGTNFSGGVFVSGVDLNRDGMADVVVGAGPGNAAITDPARVFFSNDATAGGITDGGTGSPSIVDFTPGPSWNPGYNGEGVVVTGIDSGINYDHPAIVTGPESGQLPIRVYDDQDLLNPIDQIGSFFDSALNTGVRLTAADFTGDGVDDIGISRANGLGASITVYDTTTVNGQPPTAVGAIVPYGQEVLPGQFISSVGAHVAGAPMGGAFSPVNVTVPVTPDGTFHIPNYAVDLAVKITPTNGNLPDPFGLRSINPDSLGTLTDLDGNPLELPPGFELLPFTRGLFVEEPDGVTPDKYDAQFRIDLSEAAIGFLESNELTLQNLRLTKLDEVFGDGFTAGNAFGNRPPILGAPTDTPGDWGIFTDGFESGDTFAWGNPDGFSGFVVTFVPEPTSALALLTLLPALARRTARAPRP